MPYFYIIFTGVFKATIMLNPYKYLLPALFSLTGVISSMAQPLQQVEVVKLAGEKRVDILIGNKVFTSFLYPDSLEKPVLFPVIASNGTAVTRGFPLQPVAGDPNDHPHHIGIWFNFE